MRLRPYLLVFSGLAVFAAAACGGKIATVDPGDGGPPASSGSGSGSGSSSGVPIQGPVIGGTSCVPDDQLTVQCPDPASYGYLCGAGDDPTSYDPSLVCSTPTPDPDGVHDDFCCNYPDSGGGDGGPVPAGCTPDSTLSCTTGAFGLACSPGYNPEMNQSLSCSTPTFAAGEDDYCCFSGGTWSYDTCKPDDTLTSVCPDPTSYGYMCRSGDDPTVYDALLNCSSPTPDADGVHDDFCCTYQ